MKKLFVCLVLMVSAAACTSSNEEPAVAESAGYSQQPGDLLNGEIMAMAYSGFREGQHPDRGNGANNPPPPARPS